MRSSVLVVVLAATAARASAQPLPFIRDDGDSFVEARVADGSGGGPGVLQDTLAIDVSAQELVGPRFGIYGAMGAAHVAEQDPEEVLRPTPHYLAWTASTPLDLELGGLVRAHGGGGTALTASLGVSLPTVVRTASAYQGDAYTEVGTTDSVRAVDRTAIRAGLTASVHHDIVFAAGHAGLDVAPTDEYPARVDLAIDFGLETPSGGTSVALGMGGYHVFVGGASSLALGFAIAHRIGPVDLSIAIDGGASAQLGGAAALVGAARWNL